MHMNSGYVGWSRSRRAAEAESNGILPATRAAKAHGFKSAAALRQCVSRAEWHHTSKYCNPTDYYNVPGDIEEATWQDLGGWLPHLTRAGKVEIKAAIREKLRAQLNPETERCHSDARHFKHRNNWHRHVERVAAELNAEPLLDNWYSYSMRIKPARGLDLPGAILAISAEQKRRRQQSRRSALAKSIRQAMDWHPLDRSEFSLAKRKGPNGKTFSQRKDELCRRHGEHRSRLIARRLREANLPLTDQNWRAIKVALENNP